MSCVYVFCTHEDIKKRFCLNKSFRGAQSLRLAQLVSIQRQPRPHLAINVYTSRRNLLVQNVETKIMEFDKKFEVKRRVSRRDFEDLFTTRLW